jgi:organic radical activating enzyme
MCGMQNLKTYTDWMPTELEKILQDSLFSKIESVGINGGEPFIKTNITEYITIILKHCRN